jgi:hypothetical protein
LSFGDRLSFAVGYSQLQRPADAFNKIVYIPSSLNEQTPVEAKLHLYYFSLQTDYVFYQTKRWELSSKIQFGFGQNFYSYSLAEKITEIEKHNNLIYIPGVSVEYKILRWFGVGADLGYRFILTSHAYLNRQFTSPIYSFNLNVYYFEIYKTIFPKGISFKKIKENIKHRKKD